MLSTLIPSLLQQDIRLPTASVTYMQSSPKLIPYEHAIIPYTHSLHPLHSSYTHMQSSPTIIPYAHAIIPNTHLLRRYNHRLPHSLHPLDSSYTHMQSSPTIIPYAHAIIPYTHPFRTCKNSSYTHIQSSLMHMQSFPTLIPYGHTIIPYTQPFHTFTYPLHSSYLIKFRMRTNQIFEKCIFFHIKLKIFVRNVFIRQFTKLSKTFEIIPP